MHLMHKDLYFLFIFLDQGAVAFRVYLQVLATLLQMTGDGIVLSLSVWQELISQKPINTLQPVKDFLSLFSHVVI